MRKLVLDAFKNAGIVPRDVLEFSSTESSLPFVQQDAGIAFRMEQDLLSRSGLVMIPIVPYLYRTYALVSYKDKRHDPAVECLKKYLFHHLADDKVKSDMSL